MFPILSQAIINSEYEEPEMVEGKFNGSARTLLGAIACDGLIIITFLVVGILGLTDVIPNLSSATSYAFIGISSFVPFAWMLSSCATNKGSLQLAKDLILFSVSSKPVDPKDVFKDEDVTGSDASHQSVGSFSIDELDWTNRNDD